MSHKATLSLDAWWWMDSGAVIPSNIGNMLFLKDSIVCD